MDATTPASLWLISETSQSFHLLCQVSYSSLSLPLSTFKSVKTPQLDIISNFLHAFEAFQFPSLSLSSGSPFLTFSKCFCSVQLTGMPVFMVQLSQLFKPVRPPSVFLHLSPSLPCSLLHSPPLSLTPVLLLSLHSLSKAPFLPNHFPSIFIFSLCQMAGSSCLCLLGNFLLSLCKWPLTVAQTGAAVRSNG